MTDEKVGNRRLLKLAALLRTLPRKRFDYNVWVGGSWKGAADLSCGTTACALGWATTMPSLRRLGLHLTRGGSIALGGRVGAFEAARDLFAITDDDAMSLFTPADSEFDATAKYVAEKIETFVDARA